MFISIITVVKNDFIRLKKTVASLHSFYRDRNFEHIIIDGKSGDDTYKFIQKLQLTNKNIIFKSCDDLGIYELFIKLKEYNIKDFDILCFPFQHEFEGKIIYRKPIEKTRDKLPTSHQAMFFSKKFLNQYKYNLSYKISADFDLYQDALFSRIYIITPCNALTLVESEGFASKNSNLSYREHIKIICIHYNGLSRFYLINKVILKFSIIKILNFIFPKSVIFKIRKIFYSL